MYTIWGHTPWSLMNTTTVDQKAWVPLPPKDKHYDFLTATSIIKIAYTYWMIAAIIWLAWSQVFNHGYSYMAYIPIWDLTECGHIVTTADDQEIGWQIGWESESKSWTCQAHISSGDCNSRHAPHWLICTPCWFYFITDCVWNLHQLLKHRVVPDGHLTVWVAPHPKTGTIQSTGVRISLQQTQT